MKKLIIMSLLIIPFNAAFGGIEWKAMEISLDMQPGQSHIDASFPFTVTGSKSAAIISTQVSCSCVVVDQLEGELKPGTEGTLKVRYTPAGREGTILERITVNTTDQKAPSTVLNLYVYAPPTYRLEPRNVFWNIGSDTTAKDVYFLDVTGRGYNPVQVYSTDKNYTVTLIPPDSKSFRHIIRIKPVSTKEADGAYVFVDVDDGNGVIEKTKIITAIFDPKNPKTKTN